MADYSLKGLIEFLEYAGDHGLIKSTTARSYRVAISKIEDTLGPEEAADVRTVDVESLFTRYANANKVKVSPSTLKEYRRRMTTAISEFEEYRSDPTSYKPKGGRRRKSGDGGPRSQPKSKSSETSSKGSSSAASTKHETVMGALTIPFPLRDDFLASVQIPRNLTSDEAERLASFIRTLARDFTP